MSAGAVTRRFAVVVLAVFALAVEDVEGRVQITSCGSFVYYRENDGALSVDRNGTTSASCGEL